MKNFNTKDIAFIGVFTALITMFAQIPYIGFIPLPWTYLGFGFEVTVIHVIVIAGTVLYYAAHKNVGKAIIVGTILSTVFGVNSLIAAFTGHTGKGPSPIFQNPFISVAPRIIFGLSIIPVLVMFKKLIKNNIVVYGLTAVVTTFIHTIVVLSVISFVFPQTVTTYYGNAFEFIRITFITNSFLEAGLAAVVVAPIVQRVSAYLEA